jgi:hypothetical protein
MVILGRVNPHKLPASPIPPSHYWQNNLASTFPIYSEPSSSHLPGSNSYTNKIQSLGINMIPRFLRCQNRLGGLSTKPFSRSGELPFETRRADKKFFSQACGIEAEGEAEVELSASSSWPQQPPACSMPSSVPIIMIEQLSLAFQS